MTSMAGEEEEVPASIGPGGHSFLLYRAASTANSHIFPEGSLALQSGFLSVVS